MVSLDTETTGVDLRHGARPFLVTTCNEEGEVWFWEWDVDPLTRRVTPPKEDLFEIETLISQNDLVLQNPKFDVTAIHSIGIDGDWPWDKTWDTLLAGHLLASNQPHDLTTMSLVYLGVNIQPYEDRVKKACEDARKIAKSKYPEWRIASVELPEMPSAKGSVAKNDMWLPRAIAQEENYPDDHPWWRVTSEYANADSSVTLPLFKAQRELLKERGLWEIYLERLKCLSVAHKMETRGITISRERQEELQKKYEEEAAECHRRCVDLSDGELETLPVSGTSNALKKVVHEKFGLKSNKKTAKGGDSMDKSVLEHWTSTLPPRSKPAVFIKNLSEFRQRSTAINYLEGYERFWIPLDGSEWAKGLADWFRLFPSLNPTGTDTLRWSSSNPNEQNISKKEGFNLRYAFGPAPGREWWSLDYENIELRIPAYESGEEKMIELFERPDDPPFFGSYHLLNASIIYPDLFWPLAEEKGAFKDKYKSTWYQWCKNTGFAIQYGCQEAKADATARREGSYRKLKESLPKIAELNQRMIAMANDLGYVETIPDKTVNPDRGYPISCTRSKWGSISPTVPLNYHVQSTAMWVMMKAMIKVQEYLDRLKDCYLVLQVHDEMVFDFPKGVGPEPWKTNLPKIKKIQHLMQSCGDDIGIPLKTSREYHAVSWSEGMAV